MSKTDRYEEIYCFDGSECEYKKCPLYNFDTDKCKLESLKAPRVPVGQQPQRQPEASDSPFGKLVPQGFATKIEGTLVDDPLRKDVSLKDGNVTKVTNFRITDGTTEIRVGLWEPLANEVMTKVAGDKITLLNMSVKDYYEGILQVQSNRKTELK